MIFTVLFYTFVATAVIQILYYFSFASFLSKKVPSKQKELVPISVIVCAKNEEENLKNLIPKLLSQEYQKFQIVLINDASTDQTFEIMKKFQQRDQRIKIVNVENNEAFWGNKKYALTLGIKAAKFEHLLFTDADCIPESEKWIQEMSNEFSQNKTIVLGYGKYKSIKHSFVNILVRFETLLTGIQYFSYAKLESPYMGVGRNIAYTKSEFFKVKGFINHLHIKSGDDDLFIKDAATNKNTAIATSENSFTISEPPKSLREWFQQKRRHISTASHYKFQHQFFLSLFFISKFIFLFSALISVIFNPTIIIGSVILGYYIINYLIIGFSAKQLKEKQIIYYLPFLEIFLVLFQITIFIANSISKPTHWK